ncbi:transposable element Tcb2 transposase [Trichonephila clavipes]|nr:transposable element Tcb2 transposase [Trichonephila clavipes]
MKVTWCKIRTVWQMVLVLPIKSCNMVLRCQRRVSLRIFIQKQNAVFQKHWPLFPNCLFPFRQGVTVPSSIDGSKLQKVNPKVNASSICKVLSFPARFFDAYQAKQWTNEHRTTRKIDSGRRKVTSRRDDRHLLRMAANDRTASSRQLAASWSNASGVLMSASSIHRRLLHRELRARVPLYRISFTANHRRLRLQRAHEHRVWQADWHQVIFSDESRFNLWNHDVRNRVKRYSGERCLTKCVIERHGGLTPEVMVWRRFRIMDDPTGYELRVVSIAAQRMQLLPWPDYSPDMSSIVHVWDLVGRRFARYPRPASSKDELLLRIWNSLPQADIQNLFDSMPRRTTTLNAARGGYTKY